MAQRNQVRSLLRRLDAGDPRHGEHIALGVTALHDHLQGLRAHAHPRFGHRLALGQGFIGDIDHVGVAVGIKMGETTADGMFTLQQSECQGACADSPVLLVNDRHMCSFMTNDKLDELVDGLRAAEGK